MATQQQLPPRPPTQSKATVLLPASTLPPPNKQPTGGGGGALLRPFLVRILHTLRGRFYILAGIILIFALIMTVVVAQQIVQTDRDLKIIQANSQNVDAAQKLLQYVEDVDAKSADYIAAAALTDTSSCQILINGTNQSLAQQPLTDHDCDALSIDAELILANKELYNANHNASFAGERTALERISAGLAEYYADIKTEQHEYDLAGIKFAPNNVHLINAKEAYYKATNVVNVKITRPFIPDPNNDETTIPSCTINVRTDSGLIQKTLPPDVWPKGSLEQNVSCLTAINKQHLDDAYESTQQSLGYTILLVSMLSILFCGLLIFTIWRVAQITHYVLHFMLILVTLVSFVFCGLVVLNFASLYGDQGSFNMMVRHAYETIYNTAQIRQYATAANADESRWLIAVTFSDQDQIDRWQKDWYYNRDKTSSLIQQVQNNHTSAEENQPLNDMQSHWKAYTNIDPQIRNLAKNPPTTPLYDRMIAAQTLSLGRSNENFFAFTSAIDALSKVNQEKFDGLYNNTDGFLTTDARLCVLFILVGLLAFWSLVRRTKDF